MPNVFLTFLGTSYYQTCDYYYGDKKIENVNFVQEALLQLFCHYFTSDDRIVVFLTEEARTKNWEESSKTIGLYNCIQALNMPSKIISVDIVSGNSEEEIWQVFEKIYQQLMHGDEVILDITHAFRSLPMLAMVLMNYSRFLKEITIKGIYYGAFEAKKGNEAPIFDLTSFERLQRWSIAAENFVNHGVTETIANLVYPKVNPILEESKGSDLSARKESNFAKTLDKVGSSFNTVRGKRIYKGKEINNLKQGLDQIKSGDLIIKPLRPLLDKVHQKIDPFKLNKISNMLDAVGWYINHSLIQQGITMLQETIISFILEENGYEWYAQDDATTNEKNEIRKRREAVSGAILLYGGNKKINWAYKFPENSEAITKVISSRAFQNLYETYEKLKTPRNDINHGGLIDNLEPVEFGQKLKEQFDRAKKVIYGEARY